MNIIAVIPARYASTRLPGKPLLLLNGKPMFYWVYLSAQNTQLFNKIIVATDDQRIVDSCIELGIDVEMTSKNHPTGTDRVAEVAKKYECDVIVNIQGDEPLLEPIVIKSAVESLTVDESVEVVNLMTKIINPVDLINNTVPKVIVNDDSIGIYLSRSPVPHPKGSIDYDYYKQVCVYAFRKESLLKFADYDRSRNERIEDIEILRFIDNGIKVKFVEVNTGSVAVDTLKDYEFVKKLMESRHA